VSVLSFIIILHSELFLLLMCWEMLN